MMTKASCVDCDKPAICALDGKAVCIAHYEARMRRVGGIVRQLRKMFARKAHPDANQG